MRNDDEHAFPIPESAVGTLDELKEELHHQPLRDRTADYIRSNPYPVMAVTALLGIVLGWALRNKR
jgi:ElaB/YqjD/DUF883 family membrane-anchored ribosome-binding protein